MPTDAVGRNQKSNENRNVNHPWWADGCPLLAGLPLVLGGVRFPSAGSQFPNDSPLGGREEDVELGDPVKRVRLKLA